MASLNDKVLEAGSVRKKFATDMSLAVEKRVVDISLQNPHHGARRLFGLLAGEGILISSSAVYTLLKRYSLQTPSLRHSQINLRRLAESSLPAVKTAASDTVPIPETPEEPEEIPIEKITLAEKDIGLKLMGTVVANDATLSCAILQVLKTREQDAYREGDLAGPKQDP